jgi:circadian clock protein KaiB
MGLCGTPTATGGVTSYSFQLYVTGQTERAQAAEANLRALCDSRLPGGYEIDVIDATEHPDVAEEQRVLATPMVVRTAPLPQRRVIGDLSDSRRAGYALGLPDRPSESGTGTRHD